MRLPIAAWSAWAPGFETRAAWFEAKPVSNTKSSIPDVKFIDAMTRRRLGRLARIALHVAHDCLHQVVPADSVQSVATVYASRHGDLRQTLNLLVTMAQDEVLSPTAFGLSVHNAIPGIGSMLRHDRSATTAIAAGADSFYMGLLEAAMQWQTQPESWVLYIYADEDVPEPYRQQIDPVPPQAIAMLLGGQSPIAINLPEKNEIVDVFDFVRNYLIKENKEKS